MNRYVHVCSSHGTRMPALEKAADAEVFERAAEAQLQNGRRKPVPTNVSRYVTRKAPALARVLARVLAQHGKRLAAAIAPLYELRLRKDDASTAAIIAQILDEISAEDLGADLNAELYSSLMDAYKAAAQIGLTQAGIAVDDSITNQVDEAAVTYAETHGGELVTGISSTTEDALSAVLAQGVDEGMSVDELTAAIEDLGVFSASRAETIARTELAFAHVQGNVEGWRQSGQVQGKRWILADTHPEPDECDEAADAGDVDLDADFVPGLDYPPAHPNCLCDVVPVLIDSSD